MEFTLWNLNAPGFWASSGSNCNSGENVPHVLCTSSAEELQTDEEPFSTSASPPPDSESVYRTPSDFEAGKSDSENEKDPGCLVTLGLEAELATTVLETDLELKEDESVFPSPSASKKLRADDVIGDEAVDTGQSLDDSEELPAVDNLWNNGIVGANVNVKTETVVPLAYHLEHFGPIFGRLPPRRFEPMSDDDSEDDINEREQELNIKEDDEIQEDDLQDDQQPEDDGDEDDDEEEDDEEEDPVSSVSGVDLMKFVRRAPSSSVGFECGECQFSAETRPALKKHIATVHPAPASDANLAQALMRNLSQSTSCPLASCRFRSANRSEMEAHLAWHVSGGAQASTPVPTKKKVAPVNLQRVRYEREEYRCQMCSYSCTIEKAFYKHLKLHSVGAGVSSSSKISCVVCGKDRPTEVDMNKHMRKHRDNRYFCCDICVFRTVQLKKLIQHRRMHTGEKPHLCPHCSYRSARRDNLRSHVRRVHKKENLFCDTFSPRGLILGSSASNGVSSSHD